MAFLHISWYISFYLSLRVPSKGAPSMFPNRSLWTGILRHQSHWSIYSFIYSCMSAGVSSFSLFYFSRFSVIPFIISSLYIIIISLYFNFSTSFFPALHHAYFLFWYFLSISNYKQMVIRITSTPIQILISVKLNASLPSTNTWSICLLLLPSTDCQDPLRTFLCVEVRIFYHHIIIKWIVVIWFSFDVSRGLRIPVIIFVSCVGILWYSSLSLWSPWPARPFLP